MTDSRGNGVEVIRAVTGGQPMGIAVDATDTWGRVFVADRSSDRLSVIFGRSPGLTIDCQLKVGTHPYAVAVDADTGHVLVTLRGEPRVAVVDGRADDASVLGWVELEANPAWIAIDQETRRAFVSMPEEGTVAILEPTDAAPFYEVVGTFESGPYARWLALDQATGRLLVSNDGQPETADGDLGNGSVSVFDGRAESPVRIGESIAASVPSGIAFDPVTGNAYVLENGTDELMTIVFPQAGAPTVSRSQADPYVDEGQNVNPVDLVFLPATRELITTQASRSTSPVGGHLSVLRVDDLGRPTLDRTIPASDHTTGIALDPASGRVFVSYLDEGTVAALDEADEPTVAAPPAPIAVSMPGPLEVSFAPEDVVRTVGISLFVLLLVGAPTPVFNETLESNLGQIQGGLRRLVPGRGSSGRIQRLGDRLRRFSDSPLGLLVYVLVASLIYSFLTPGFPSDNGLVVFGVAVLGLAAVTAADIVPGQRYVMAQVLGSWAHPRRPVDARARGRVRVHQPPVGDAAGVHVRDHRCLRVHGRARRRGRGSHGGAGCRRVARRRRRRLVRADPVRADAGRPGLRPRPDDQSRAGRHLHRRGRGSRVRPHPAQLPARPAHLGVESLALARPLGGRPRALRARPRLPGHGGPAEP